MSDVTRVELAHDDLNREPTADELANVPVMSAKERTEVMRSEEYRKSSLVRKLVAASIAKHDPMARVDASPDEQPMEQVQAKQAAIQKFFRDPRYKHDAAYRFEVHKHLAEITADDNAELAGLNAHGTNQSFSVSVSKSPFHGADLRARTFARVELDMKPTGPDAPAKKKTEPFS